MSVERDPDAALMLRVRQGDDGAFAELIGKYQQSVCNLAIRMLRDATEAEDIAQHVFVQVYKSAGRYEVSAKFSTWLFTITRNLCLNEIRRRSRHPADSLDETHRDREDQPRHQIVDPLVPAPEAGVLHGELEDLVSQAIADLPDNQRDALLLCRQEDLSYDEISQILGCSLSATKSLIHRGRETIKQRLKPYLRTGEWHK